MAHDVIEIDGSQGEGGGQILRTAVGLAAAWGRPVRVVRIRAGRPNPGLRPQHLAAVRAAAAVCGAKVEGAKIGASELEFLPGPVRPGQYQFDVGTAGSTVLVLQTVLPALALAEGDSELTVLGGTHNPMAPSFEYLRDVFCVLAGTANIEAHFEMDRAGFYPAGGGRVRAMIRGVGSPEGLEPFRLTSRGNLLRIEGLSAVSDTLPAHIRERQARRAVERLAEAGHAATVDQAAWDTASPGTAVFLRAVFSRGVAGFGALGERGKPAEKVADEATEALLDFLASPGAVDAHAADQLLVLAALCPRASRLRAERVSNHLLTVAALVEQFTGRTVSIEMDKDRGGLIVLAGA